MPRVRISIRALVPLNCLQMLWEVVGVRVALPRDPRLGLAGLNSSVRWLYGWEGSGS